MSIIRSASIQKRKVLSPNGTLLVLKEKEAVEELHEDECRKAYQKGYDKGKELGFEKALSEVKVLMELLHRMGEKLLEQKKRLLEQLKPEIIEFAMVICEGIIRKELSQPEIFAKLINSLLHIAASSMQQEVVQIVLAPDDLLLLEGHLSQMQLDKQEMKKIRFVSDPLICRGDCRIESKTRILNHEISRELFDLQSKLLQR